MKRHELTSMGGQREEFLTTHWSLIEDVKQHPDEDRALIGLLLERYWKPIYCYLRRKGHDNEQAKDLTQGFLHEVILNRQLLNRTYCKRGRFRTLLLHALNQYLIDERRKEGTLRRIPKDKLVPLDWADPQALPQMACQLDAEQSYDYVWKTELLARVLKEVEAKYAQRGMATHWYVFRDRLLEPTLQDREAPSLKDICQRYGIEDESTASNLLKTVKRLFRSVLEKHIRQTVLSGEVIEEELQEIFRFMKKERTK